MTMSDKVYRWVTVLLAAGTMIAAVYGAVAARSAAVAARANGIAIVALQGSVDTTADTVNAHVNMPGLHGR